MVCVFILDMVSLRVDEALPRKSGDGGGSPFRESGLFLGIMMVFSSATIFVGVNDVNAPKSCGCGCCITDGLLNAKIN